MQAKPLINSDFFDFADFVLHNGVKKQRRKVLLLRIKAFLDDIYMLKFLLFITFCMLLQTSCVFYYGIKSHNENINSVKLKSKELEGKWKLAHIKTADTFYTPEKEIILNFEKWGYSVLNEAPGELIINIETDTFKYLSYTYFPAKIFDYNRIFFYKIEDSTIQNLSLLPKILTKSLVTHDEKQSYKETQFVCEFSNKTMTLTLKDELNITLIRKD